MRRLIFLKMSISSVADNFIGSIAHTTIVPFDPGMVSIQSCFFFFLVKVVRFVVIVAHNNVHMQGLGSYHK